jgi:hypothetical protein
MGLFSEKVFIGEIVPPPLVPLYFLDGATHPPLSLWGRERKRQVNGVINNKEM